MALCLQASIAAIKTDKEGAALAAARAEDVVPGDPEILSVTWGQGRVLASLFRDECTRAVREDAIAASYAEQVLSSARSSTGCTPTCRGRCWRQAGHWPCTPSCKRSPSATPGPRSSRLGRPRGYQLERRLPRVCRGSAGRARRCC